ncbi:MAG: endopeptidase La [Prevotellaceae bacterium]|jgi:ATP-dependent Lon protease|nr:endopeptidase La [Prevotellaceae bacterium]
MSFWQLEDYMAFDKLGKIFIAGAMGENIGFIPLNEDSSENFTEKELPMPLPMLVLRNAVLFPLVVMPITVGRDKSIKLIREAYSGSRMIGAVGQKDPNIEEPEAGDLYRVGTLARILKIFEMPDGAVTVLLQGIQRFVVDDYVQQDPYFTAYIRMLTDVEPPKSDKDFEAIIGAVKDSISKMINFSMHMPPEASFAIRNIENPKLLINFISANIEFENHNDRQVLLEIGELKERALKLVELLGHEIQLMEIKNDIQQKVRSEMDQQQREYFLHQQIKTIQNELGNDNDATDSEVERLVEKASSKKWPQYVKDTFDKELNKFEKMNPLGGEFSVQLNYLDILTDLPWDECSQDNLDLNLVKDVLDEDHFGLEEVKERILEYLSVIKLKGDLKSPIICLHGPPGVGKTSLGKSVARALGRKFGRISLGGLHDEAEIRGHRRTYIGAMPGRIVQTINRCKTSNPVIILDEIDKVGNDFKGDPSSALLEVLDPEQNSTFRDNYLDLDYDLSRVMFITTANRVDTIHPALRDRMEMINLTGYISQEKLEIAKRHLIPKALEAHGVKPKQLSFDDSAIETIIDEYTHESGVRNLDKQIAKIIRNRAKALAFGEKFKKKISAAEAKKILGTSKIQRDVIGSNNFVGVTTGLAWTEAGGEILFVEASISPGKGALQITGNLGDVMKESAKIALEYIKAHASSLNINEEMFEKKNVHIHVPEGAIPKDGPSAGITMLTSIASIFTGRKVQKGIAMTGEITLRGKVLSVGGVKEKILAAKRAGVSTIILSADNKKNIAEIKQEYLEGLTFKYVTTMKEVLSIALETKN